MFDTKRHVDQAKKITNLLDNKFKIAGHSFGLDPLIGLIPGIGDLVPAAISGYIIWIAYNVGMPSASIMRMVFNTGLDFIIGQIPAIGDLVDFFYKSHTKNLGILLNYVESKNSSSPDRLSRIN